MNGDVSKKTILITGANAGLGYETALALAKRKATILMICRNKERGEQAHKEIIEKSGNKNVELFILDCSRPYEVKKFTDDWLKSGRAINVLINNVGVLTDERSQTPEKLDFCFATNTMSTFLMTEWLLPALQKEKPARVITICSGGMYTVKMENTNWQGTEGKWDGLRAYSITKRHQLYCGELWAEKATKSTGINFLSCHPGWARTPGTKTSLPKWFDSMSLRTAEEGADTIVWLAVAEKLDDPKYSGKFFFR